MDSSARSLIASYLIAIEGIQIFNEIGSAIAFGREDFALAARLETWYMSYKELWRENSRAGDCPLVEQSAVTVLFFIYYIRIEMFFNKKRRT